MEGGDGGLEGERSHLPMTSCSAPSTSQTLEDDGGFRRDSEEEEPLSPQVENPERNKRGDDRDQSLESDDGP